TASPARTLAGTRFAACFGLFRFVLVALDGVCALLALVHLVMIIRIRMRVQVTMRLLPLAFAAAIASAASTAPAARTLSAALLAFAVVRLRGLGRWRGGSRSGLGRRLMMMRPIHMHDRSAAVGNFALRRALDHELADMHVLVGRHGDRDAVAHLDVVQMRALL